MYPIIYGQLVNRSIGTSIKKGHVPFFVAFNKKGWILIMKIGIDIGGSHIGIGLVNENGKIIEKYETDLSNNSNITEFIEKYIIENVKKIQENNNIDVIGIASPGAPKNGKITTMVNLGIKELDITNIIQKY